MTTRDKQNLIAEFTEAHMAESLRNSGHIKSKFGEASLINGEWYWKGWRVNGLYPSYE